MLAGFQESDGRPRSPGDCCQKQGRGGEEGGEEDEHVDGGNAHEASLTVLAAGFAKGVRTPRCAAPKLGQDWVRMYQRNNNSGAGRLRRVRPWRLGRLPRLPGSGLPVWVARAASGCQTGRAMWEPWVRQPVLYAADGCWSRFI